MSKKPTAENDGRMAITQTPNAVIVEARNNEAVSEEALQTLKNTYSKMIDDRNSDIDPVIIARTGKKLIVTQLRKVDGVWVLPEVMKGAGPISRLKLAWKRRRVNRIMARIDKVLKAQIGEVTEIALMRKSDEQLKNLETRLYKTKNSPPRLTNRVGCIYLEIGDEAVQI